MSLLQQFGYTGSDRTLMRYLKQLREAQGVPPRRVQSTSGRPKVSDLQLPSFTARRASFLIVKLEQNRETEEVNRCIKRPISGNRFHKTSNERVTCFTKSSEEPYAIDISYSATHTR
jgi:hypothetical protein